MSNYQAVFVINEPGMVLPSSMTTEVGVSLLGLLNPETLSRPDQLPCHLSHRDMKK